MPQLLDESAIEDALKKLPEWELDGDSITRTIEFEEFMEGVDFINDVAEIAEELQHHPDISVQYTKITLVLTTHQSNGLTELDFETAQRIDNLLD